MRVLFLGTPDFAIPTLRAIVASSHEVVGVVTQPDREGKRKMMTPPAVKVEAERLGLPVYQFESLRKQGVELVRSLSPDVMVTAAFGQILSQELLDLPRYGVLNVHGSLLPKYRGASPIQSCLLAGDAETGVTIMRTAYEVDSGDVVLKKSIPISETDTAGTLFDKIALLGAEGAVEALDLLERGEITYTLQNHAEATFCKMITKADGEIFASTDAAFALRMVRAYNPWPVAFLTTEEGARLRVYTASPLSSEGEPGTFFSFEGDLCINLTGGAIRLLSVQPEGKKAMSGADYLLGHASILTKRLG